MLPNDISSQLPYPQLSRTQLLTWINTFTHSSLSKIQQLGTGIPYCQILDSLHPRCIPPSKLNLKAKTQYQFINNYKLLQQCFTKLGIYKNIEIERLVKCKYQDNLEFLQWFHRYFEGQVGRKEGLNSSSSYGGREKSGNRSIKKRTPSFLIPGNISKIEGREKGPECGSFEDVLVLEDLGTKGGKRVGGGQGEQEKEMVEFYKAKLMEIQGLVEGWDGKRGAKELGEEVNRILLRPPAEVEILKDIIFN